MRCNSMHVSGGGPIAQLGLPPAVAIIEDSSMKPISRLSALIICVLGLAGGLGAQNQPELSNKVPMRIQKEVRHELLMLPLYDVFDNFEYKVEGGIVTLMGRMVSELHWNGVVGWQAANEVRRVRGQIRSTEGAEHD